MWRVLLLATLPAFAHAQESDCAAVLLGQIGCLPGENRYPSGFNDDNPSNDWIEPLQGYRGAQVYDPRRTPTYDPGYQGTLRGGNPDGCGTLLSGPCN